MHRADTAESSDEYLFDPRRVPPDDREVGRFRLLHELGSGGMATLYLALDEEGRLVATKQLHAHLAGERRFVEMFVDEAAIASRIHHPHVCKVHGLERAGERLLMVMEYVHGESLAALCRAVSGEMITSCGPPGQLPVEVALHLVGQACLGLHAAHELRGEGGQALAVVHRDVSPQNLLVSYDGELKVVDFGIAAAVAKLHHTRTGTIKGKFCYMSPEQARGAEVDRRSDLFSLGAVLYEALCGQPAFPMTNMVDTIRRVEAVQYLPPREHRPELPDGVVLIVERALQQQPVARYHSAAAMYEAIYDHLARSRSNMTTRTIGELMRRAFARRYALREELLGLAFAAPEVLAQEELVPLSAGPVTQGAPGSPAATAVETPAPAGAQTRRCEFCGETLAGDKALAAHSAQCAQRRWWEHNFGGDRQHQGAGDAALLREDGAPRLLHPAARVERTPAPRKEGFWLRLKKRLRGEGRDPLVVRLEAIDGRLERVRDRHAVELAGRAMGALWGVVAEIGEKSPVAGGLLDSIKPRLVRCGNALLGLTLEIDANAAYLAGGSDREIARQLETLCERQRGAAAGPVRDELSRNVQRKEALLAERRQVAQLSEVLRLRLEQMVDAVETAYGRVRQLAASPAFADAEANTQVSVLVDSLLLEVEQLGACARELRDAMQ